MQLGIQMARITMALVFATYCVTSNAAIEVAGHRFDDTLSVNGQQLRLNGAGIRTKLLINLYAAALYVTEKHSAANDILTQPGAKRVVMVMLRNFSSDTFAQAFIDGIKKNSDLGERSRFINQMMTFGQYFATVQELKEDDVLTVDWIPNAGTVISINGKALGNAILNEGFYQALLKIWLGANPTDAKLKAAMLGADS